VATARPHGYDVGATHAASPYEEPNGIESVDVVIVHALAVYGGSKLRLD